MTLSKACGACHKSKRRCDGGGGFLLYSPATDLNREYACSSLRQLVKLYSLLTSQFQAKNSDFSSHAMKICEYTDGTGRIIPAQSTQPNDVAPPIRWVDANQNRRQAGSSGGSRSQGIVSSPSSSLTTTPKDPLRSTNNPRKRVRRESDAGCSSVVSTSSSTSFTVPEIIEERTDLDRELTREIVKRRSISQKTVRL